MIEVKLVFKAPQSKCKQRKFSNLRRNSKIPPKKITPNPENTVFLKQIFSLSQEWRKSKKLQMEP
jgi:hypothetical protein